MPRCDFKLELDYPEPLAGVDEAGCAPLAGPVVAAAVILDRNCFPRGIDDSKKLPIDKREAIHARLLKCATIAFDGRCQRGQALPSTSTQAGSNPATSASSSTARLIASIRAQ